MLGSQNIKLLNILLVDMCIRLAKHGFNSICMSFARILISILDVNKQEEHSRMANQLERGRIQVEAKDRHADDIRKDVELASVEADKILADQVDLDLKLKVSSGFHAMHVWD